MHKQKWFTLIEILLVLAIMVIITSMIVTWFWSLDTEKSYAEACVNSFYGDISNRVYYAQTSKILTWDIIPTKYVINGINKTWLDLNYTQWNIPRIFKHLSTKTYSNCTQKTNFWIELSSTFNLIELYPALQWVWNEIWFQICSPDCNNASNYQKTWAINFRFCWKDKNNSNSQICSDFWQILFDARVGSARKRFCRGFTWANEDECYVWTTGKD